MSLSVWFSDLSINERRILLAMLALIAVWLVRHLVISWAVAQLDFLDPNSPKWKSSIAPLVTAIIPAKDEEEVLGDCLESVGAQDYPNLEIVVVNDRSTDRTAAIAQEFADRDPRVRVLTIDHLPDGWTGKTHALQFAADHAEGEWLWFLDADTRHAPENLGIVLRYAFDNRAAMASLLPEMRCETFWEDVVQPLAGIVLIQSFPLFRVNDDTKPTAFANGQYILIRRDAYQAVGGHASVKDRFVEDIYLAKEVKALGLPIRVAIAHGIGSTRMYASLGRLVRGWSRILYDALGRNPWRVAGKIIDPLIFSQPGQLAFLASLWMLAFGDRSAFAVALLILSVVHHLVSYSVLARVYKLTVPGSRHVGWFPLANLVMDWVLLRSLWMCLTGRVVWRGTSYARPPSKQVRSNPTP